MDIFVGPRQKRGATAASWQIEANANGLKIITCYEFLRWDDIVRRHWPKRISTQVKDTLETTWHYLISGATRLMYKAYPRTVHVLATPIALLALIGISTLFFSAVSLTLVGQIGIVRAALLWAGCLGLLVLITWMIERRMRLAWLMRSYTFTAKYARGEVPSLDDRIISFGSRIAEIASGRLDEVLVVGHSSGSFVAVAAVAEADVRMANENPGSSSPAYSLMTLGHCIPMLSLLPEASRFRSQLARTTESGRWAWIDFSAPADGSSFVVTAKDKNSSSIESRGLHGPMLLSPRFPKLFPVQKYRELVANKMEYHFQYLMAADLPGDYDYFAITAGELVLSERFPRAGNANRAPEVRGN